MFKRNWELICHKAAALNGSNRLALADQPPYLNGRSQFQADEHTGRFDRLNLAGSDGRPTAASEKQNLNGSFPAANLKASISVPDPLRRPAADALAAAVWGQAAIQIFTVDAGSSAFPDGQAFTVELPLQAGKVTFSDGG